MSMSRQKFCAAVTAVAALVALIFPASATANPGEITAEDQSFLDSLAKNGILYAPGLQIRQGQRWCEDVIGGSTDLDAVYELMRMGDYSFDEANVIHAAAAVNYCYCASSFSQIPLTDPSCSPFETSYIGGGSGRNGYY